MNTAIIAAVVFAGLFSAWVIVPTILKKKHESKNTIEIIEE